MNYCLSCGDEIKISSSSYCGICSGMGFPRMKVETHKLPTFLKEEILESCKMYLREIKNYNKKTTGFKDPNVYSNIESVKQLVTYVEGL